MTDPSSGPQSGTLYWLPRILGDRSLDAVSALLLVGLADHVGQDDTCYVGIRRLAGYARCSYSTAQRRLGELEAAGRIARAQRQRSDGGDSVYTYTLLRVDPPGQVDQGVGQADRAPRSPGCEGPPGHLGDRAEPPKDEPPTGEPSDALFDAGPPHVVDGGVEITDAAFEQWWTAYPRKVGKADARKAYQAAVKACPPARLLDAVERYAQQRAGEDPRFTAHPGTWLRQGRWDDEPVAPRRQGRPIIPNDDGPHRSERVDLRAVTSQV